MNWLIHPIQTIKDWGVKTFVLGIVNTAIEKYNGNIQTARAYVARYASKVSALLRFLNSLDATLADGKLTEAEADALVSDAKDIAKELVS